MNQTVHSIAARGVADGRSTRHEGRRRRLMDDAIQYVLSHGISDLSIRPMAEALGITHRTLLHHFGSKEQMVERVLAEIRSRQLQQLRRQAERQEQDPLTMLDETWKQIATPKQLPFWRAFLEIYAVAVKDPARHAEFLAGMVNAWLPLWVDALVEQGLAKSRAESLATLVHSSCRGLLLDLLTTGESARVERGYKLLREVLQREINETRGKRLR